MNCFRKYISFRLEKTVVWRRRVLHCVPGVRPSIAEKYTSWQTPGCSTPSCHHASPCCRKFCEEKPWDLEGGDWSTASLFLGFHTVCHPTSLTVSGEGAEDIHGPESWGFLRECPPLDCLWFQLGLCVRLWHVPVLCVEKGQTGNVALGKIKGPFLLQCRTLLGDPYFLRESRKIKWKWILCHFSLKAHLCLLTSITTQ